MSPLLRWAGVASIATLGLYACSSSEEGAAPVTTTDAGPSDAGVDVEPGVPSTVGDILGGLGVTEYANPPPVVVRQIDGGTRVIDPATWHPLKKSPAVFAPRAEVFMVGTTTALDGGVTKAGYAGDGVGASPYAVQDALPLAADQTLFADPGVARAAVAADVDGDGLQEITLLYAKAAADKNLYFRVYDDGAFGPEGLVAGVVLSGESLNRWAAGGRTGSLGTPAFPYFSATRGDLDGDGKDSILFADKSTLYILTVAKGANGSWTAGFDLNTGSHLFPSAISSVAAGDIDGDGAEELAIGFVNQWALYRGGFTTPITNPAITTVASGAGPVEVTFGDFAGSQLKQLAIATERNDGAAYVQLYDFGPGQPGLGAPRGTIKPTENRFATLPGIHVEDFFRLLPRAVDLRGDGKAALEVLGQVFDTPLTANDTTQPSLKLGDYTTDLDGEYDIIDVQVGDVDNDAKQDLVYLTSGSVGKVWAYGMNGALPAAMVRKHAYSVVAAPYVTFSFVTSAMAVGHFEDNAPRVKFDKHKLTFSDPIVIAVLASPPYWSDLVSENPTYASSIGNWTTTFGRTTTTAGSSSTSLGFSVGFTVEYEHKIDTPIFNIAKFKGSFTFNSTHKWEWSDSREVTKSVIFSATAGQDNVIFTAVPIDDYAYTILATNDPVNNPVGGSLHITIPREFSTYMVERTFFNAHTNPAMTAPIDARVLPHTLGKANSYPTIDQKNATMAAAPFERPGDVADYQYGGADEIGTMVAESDAQSAGIALEIEVTTGHENTESHDFSFDRSMGVGGGDWLFSLNLGFQVGYSSTSSTANGTSFGGTVGSLPSAKWGTSYQYRSGLYAYPFVNSFGRTLWVVNYWVTPAK